MKKLLLGLLIYSLFIISCKNDNPDPSPGVDKFMSVTAGSTWNYSYTDNNASANNYNYMLTSTDRDTSSAGKSYHVFSNSNGPNEYYNITGSDYFTLQVFSLGTTDTTLTNLYLKDNVAAGTTWAQDYMIDIGLPVNVTVTNKLEAKGINLTVGATAYTNVIHIITTITSSTIALIPGSSLTTDIHYYYAPKVGLIQNDSKIDVDVPGIITQHTDTKTTLTSATIL
ncbi:MAG: hypothetical protein ABIO04_07485 [Ferruginibacter sp.]